MPKLIIALILGLVIITGTIGGLMVVKNKQNSSTTSVSPVGDKGVMPVTTQDNLIEDEWGLKISYPADLHAEAVTGPGELTRYNFTYPGRGGYITIATKEAKESSISDWLASDKESALAGASLDTAVGKEVAKKIRFDNPNHTRIAALQTGQVFLFDVYPTDGEEEFWNKRFNGIVEKFEFLPFEGDSVNSGGGSQDTTGGGDSGEVVQEEEVVE